MLDLLKTYAGCPSEIVQLSLSRFSLVIYGFAETIVILNALNLRLIRVLAFWEAFPATLNSNKQVKVVITDPGLRLVGASMGCQLAFWSLSDSGTSALTAKVHSTMSLNGDITTVDCKSGLLAIGTSFSLSVYTLTLQNNLPTWMKKWEKPVPALNQLSFSPSLTHIASLSLENKRVLYVYLTAIPQETQTIRHPRPIVRFIWRTAKSHSRPDLTLYTLTSDSVIRVFHPVLDAPQRLQLHCTLDSRLFLPSPFATSVAGSSIFPLDRQTLANDIMAIIGSHRDSENVKECTPNGVEKESQSLNMLKAIQNEEWDLFLRILNDGSVLIRGIANIDRRPPTLLKQFTVLKTPPSAFNIANLPDQLVLSSVPSRNKERPPPLILITFPPLATHHLRLGPFFDGRERSLTLQASDDNETYPHDLESQHIERFVRTADGKGLGVIRTNGGESWCLDAHNVLRRVGYWSDKGLLVVLHDGYLTALYNEQTKIITFQNHFTKNQHILPVPPLTNIFPLPSSTSHTILIGVTETFSIIQIKMHSDMKCDEGPVLLSEQFLPLDNLHHILPVDPMAWGFLPTDAPVMQHDALVSISTDGTITFWASNLSSGQDDGSFKCTSSVRTNRRDIRMARCSSVQKTVLVAPYENGEEITIWDSKQSHFSIGLEYRQVLRDEIIKDLDWTSTNGQSVLAIGYSRHVILLCQQRMTYFEHEPAWGVFGKVDISNLTPYPISDSIWLSGGTLLVGVAHQVLHYGQYEPVPGDQDHHESLFEAVNAHNGPLVDYHPQMLLQCLLWDKLEYVKEILVGLYGSIKSSKDRSESTLKVQPLLINRILRKEELHMSGGYGSSSAFYEMQSNHLEDDNAFTKDLAGRLISLLEDSNTIPDLTANEKAHLIVLVQTVSEVDEQRRSLDSNGLRYLISMRSFYILNERASSSRSNTGGRERLRYRDMVWAFHSESQDILLNASIEACGRKMTWDDAKALGVFIWMEATESMRAHMENIGRSEYISGDPTKCSLFYFALGKVRLVHGLWRQAAGNKEQAIMLRFLANDFQEERWKTAALKNAYVLLSKQRFALAAAFFLLGESLKDAVAVCVKQLNDVQLAIALARVVEQKDDGPVFQRLLKDVILPLGFKDGNRYLCSWAFWKLHRRDFAVRVLVTPLSELVKGLDIPIQEVNEELQYDDPSLALLFSQLKSKTLQAAKGTSEISEQTEFNFILQMARVFCRMGCHALALDLTASWSFERPALPRIRRVSAAEDMNEILVRPFNRHVRRRSSIMIDMDIPSIPATESSSPRPVPTSLPTVIDEEPEVTVNGSVSHIRSGIGNLLKTAKQDVTVPEFDINAFF